MNKDKIGIFSFFSGAGFLDLGFEKTKHFETLFVNEYHKPFMDIYKYSRNLMNIKPPKYGHHVCDITDFLKQKGSDILQYSIDNSRTNFKTIGFIGGPPCPDFSIAGKNKGIKGENGKLSGTYIDLIIKYQPDFFLFENVKGLYRTNKHREFFDSIKSKLSKNNYLLTEKLINAIEYGSPQDRERIILIGFNKGFFRKNGFENKSIDNFDWDHKIKYSKENVFSKSWPTQDSFSEDSDLNCPNNILKKLTVEYWFEKNDVNNHPNSVHFFKPKAGLSKFKSIAEGDDLKKSYKRLHRWRYSPTAAYGNNEVHLHPYKARRITAAEALSLQSLPKEFILPDDISLTNMFKSIGNGVPYLAAKALAETILFFIHNSNIHEKTYSK